MFYCVQSLERKPFLPPSRVSSSLIIFQWASPWSFLRSLCSIVRCFLCLRFSSESYVEPLERQPCHPSLCLHVSSSIPAPYRQESLLTILLRWACAVFPSLVVEKVLESGVMIWIAVSYTFQTWMNFEGKSSWTLDIRTKISLARFVKGHSIQVAWTIDIRTKISLKTSKASHSGSISNLNVM